MQVHIVIIEDEEIEAQGEKKRILRMQSPWIGEVSVFYKAKDAVDFLRDFYEPALALVDINMPGMSGLDLMEILQKKPLLRYIVVSAYDKFSYAQKAMSFGARRYLLKPCPYMEFKEAVEEAVLELVNEVQRRDGWIRGTETEEQKGSEEVHQSVKWVLGYLEEHIGEKVNMAELANELDLNYSYFSQLFKKETGKTFQEYMMDIRMKKAGELLIAGEKAEEIALQVGFGNAKSFFRAFKEYFGMPPMQWKHLQESGQ